MLFLRTYDIKLKVLGIIKMSELLEIYSLDGQFLQVQDRDEYYKEIREEFKATGQITRKVKSIRLLLMNSRGRIYVQRRSPWKKENPNLYDKTIGGHVKASYPLELTVVQECHEELGFPAVILPEEQFSLAIKATDVQIIGLLKKLETISTFISVRKSEAGEFKEPFISSFYIGYYDGSIRFCDGESTGIQVFTRDELEQQIQQVPDEFTEDLKFMIKRYREQIVPINFEEKAVMGYDEN